MEIDLTPEELYWIERTADIETSMLLKQLSKNVELLSKAGAESTLHLLTYNDELMKAYDILQELRTKLEELRNGTRTI